MHEHRFVLCIVCTHTHTYIRIIYIYILYKYTYIYITYIYIVCVCVCVCCTYVKTAIKQLYITYMILHIIYEYMSDGQNYLPVL